MRSAIAIVLLALVTVACGIPPQDRETWTEPQTYPFITGPYIIVGGDDIAYIALKARLPEPPVVEWWPADADPAAPGVVQRVSAAPVRDLWVATLSGLPPADYVQYRVLSAEGNSDTHRFRIGVKPGESFRFAAFGDTRDGHSVHREVVEAVAREKVDFVMSTGDMVAQGNIEEQWDTFFQIERPLLTDTPILPAIGNHDMGSGDLYDHYFLLRRWTGGRQYFSHDWGNLRVVAVDSGIECREGCAQYGFAERELKEAADKGMLIVVSLHHPPYSSGKHGSDKNVQKPITDLSRRHGVELVVAGHDHNYERTKPIHGTTYIVSGSAGAPIRPVSPRWFTAHARTEPHYVLVDVEPSRLIVRAVNLRGDVFDSAVIEHNPPHNIK